MEGARVKSQALKIKNWVEHRNSSENVDIITQLWLKNLEHVLFLILNQLDSKTQLNCKKVSTDWNWILNSLYKNKSLVMNNKHEISMEGDICAISGNSESLFVGLNNGYLNVFERSSFSLKHTVKLHIGPITALACYSNFIASGTTKGTVRIWKMDQFQLMASLPNHRDQVTSIEYFPLLHSFLSISLDGSIQVIPDIWRRRKCFLNNSLPSAIYPSTAIGALESLDCGKSKFVFGGDAGLWIGSCDKTLGLLFDTLPLDSCSFCAFSTLEEYEILAVEKSAQRNLFQIDTTLCEIKRIITIPGTGIITSLKRTEKMLYLVTSDRFLHLFTKNQNEESKLLPAFPTMVWGDEYSAFVSCPKRASTTLLECFDFGFTATSEKSLTETNQTTRFCFCGYDIPTFGDSIDHTEHLLLTCPLFQRQRRSLRKLVTSILGTFDTLKREDRLGIMLYGLDELDLEESVKLQMAVQTFILAVNNYTI